MYIYPYLDPKIVTSAHQARFRLGLASSLNAALGFPQLETAEDDACLTVDLTLWDKQHLGRALHPKFLF